MAWAYTLLILFIITTMSEKFKPLTLSRNVLKLFKFMLKNVGTTVLGKACLTLTTF
jgi:hypothetical protein